VSRSVPPDHPDHPGLRPPRTDRETCESRLVLRLVFKRQSFFNYSIIIIIIINNIMIIIFIIVIIIISSCQSAGEGVVGRGKIEGEIS